MKKLFTIFLLLAGLYTASFAQHSWPVSFYFKYPKGAATVTFFAGRGTMNEGQPYTIPSAPLATEAASWGPVYKVFVGSTFLLESGAIPTDRPIDSMQVTLADLNPNPSTGFFKPLVDQVLWWYTEVVVYTPGKIFSVSEDYMFTPGKFAKITIPITTDLHAIWALIGINPSNPQLGLAFLKNGLWTPDGALIKVEGPANAQNVVFSLPHFSKFGAGTKTLSVTGVEEKKINSVPSAFELGQNYPNPFNPSTKIAFSLPESGNVSLKIHNSLGVEVATLASGFKSAGSYEVTFSAANLPSGIYFYTLSAGSKILTNKMMLIK